MENKEITIYKLMGLIKDGEAPKKVKYEGHTYVFAGDDYSKDDDRAIWSV